MTAEAIARALGGRKVGRCWTARCPAHDDRDPSLSINDVDGRVLVHCHAGCHQRAVIAALKQRGLWAAGMAQPQRRFYRPKFAVPSTEQVQLDPSAGALALWQSSAPAIGTPVQAYLARRGLTLPLPPSLRFHRGLKHPSGGVWPSMVALVSRGAGDSPQAVHRTFLSGNGIGKAPIKPAKMMLGPCRGGAVRLGAPADLLMVGEGIETCLAAMQATGRPAWAALSTSGLRTVDIPHGVREVIVLADGDDPGEAAARDFAKRLMHEGRHVRIARPPKGMDFNDVLLSHATHSKGDEQ